MKTVFSVKGMTCQHCVNSVVSKLEQVAGVEQVEVTLLPPRAVVTGSDIQLGALALALSDTRFLIQPLP